MLWAAPRALEMAGRSIPAKIAMIAITTRSSISVNVLTVKDLQLAGLSVFSLRLRFFFVILIPPII
jgi:hypothetical protein